LSITNRLAPRSPEELAGALAAAAAKKQTITLGGRFSKNRMAGPIEDSAVAITTSALTRVRSYEPQDLTISVEAGLPFIELTRLLAQNRQMIPLDPPFADEATIGGVVASNCSGPRRRLYGTARDLVIGMTFATLDGKLVQSGGMVVKNVAGLDMGKLMIGSFGTLAAMAVLNFKLQPMPQVERLFLISFDTIERAIEARDKILKSVLQPSSLDLLNAKAAQRLGWSGYILAVEAGGNAAVIGRYEKELRELGDLRIGDDAAFRSIQDFTRWFLATAPGGAVVRISCTLSQLRERMESIDAPALARAGNGVCYAYFDHAEAASEVVARTPNAIIEFAPEALKTKLNLWPAPGPEFELMKRIKHMFDPENLLNRGRLYRQL
jgi:glycolate oxidase FAD binding subunit